MKNLALAKAWDAAADALQELNRVTVEMLEADGRFDTQGIYANPFSVEANLSNPAKKFFMENLGAPTRTVRGNSWLHRGDD